MKYLLSTLATIRDKDLVESWLPLLGPITTEWYGDFLTSGAERFPK